MNPRKLGSWGRTVLSSLSLLAIGGCSDAGFEFQGETIGVVSQAMVGYYDGVDTSSGAALRATLHDAIDDHQWIPYTSSATDTWDVLDLADEDPNDPNNILDVYRNATFAKAGGGNSDYNREHTWPKSYGFPNQGSTNYPHNDCHQLFLSYDSYNSSRGNNLYDNCDAGCAEKPTDLNNTQGGGSGTYPGNSNWRATGVWETWNGRRGDVARALLYLDVRYEGDTHGVSGVPEPDLILTDDPADVVADTSSNTSVAYMGLRAVLLQWHADDPVSADEIARNETVFSFQGNRNPFIDHPEWVDCVFNDVCNAGCSVNADCDDGVFCNGGEVCNAGSCEAGAAACPGQQCDEASDACVDCLSSADCLDGAFCNGAEACSAGSCVSGSDPCPGQQCDEAGDSCVECTVDADCNDGNFCNGTETCNAGSCVAGGDPCSGQQCDEAADSCVECVVDADCDDGNFCSGTETCSGGSCVAGGDPCPGMMCDEQGDTCANCLTDNDCNDGLFCSGTETCTGGGCTSGSDPCVGRLCDEAGSSCVDCFSNADCDDSDACTIDVCDVAGSCSNDPDPGCAPPSLVWINEIHYENSGSDRREGVEVAGPAGMALSGYSLVAYNGNGGASYKTKNLSGSLNSEAGGGGVKRFAWSGLQNGPDGIALVDPFGVVVQFLCYEGTFSATNGPALGQTCVDIGVNESSSSHKNDSLQLGGSGCAYSDFTWEAPQRHTRNDVNRNQSFACN